MNTYETYATVQDQGRVLVAGVPFARGTEVEVTIIPKRSVEESAVPPDDDNLAATRERMRELFSTIKGFRNSPRISREDLQHRGKP